jgi:putative selenium metabolism protein SsnA
MDNYLITNGTVITLGEKNEVIEGGALYIKEGKIEEVGPSEQLSAKYGCPVKINAKNKVILPGFICAHHHLYSSMARGFAPPGEPAATFGQILERLWWKLDKALSAEDVRYSALDAFIECIRNGTTTLLDHHASPSCRDGSLDLLAEAVLESGLRASLCYEVSDRNVPGAGIEENERFFARLQQSPSPQLAALMGIHASFTVSDATLARCRDVAEKYNCGYHIHVAEGVEDHQDALQKYGMRTVERLVARGISGPQTLYVHCINVDDQEIDLIAQTSTLVVHNPESNMNNAVGAARILEMMKRGILVGLGTDGMASDMPAQMRCGYLLQRLALKDPRVAFVEAPQLLLGNNAKIANRYFPVKLGVLEKGAAADIAILDYIPPTPLKAENFLGHFIFGMVDATVDSTIVGGKILMQDKRICILDEERIAAMSRELAPKMWKRIH